MENTTNKDLPRGCQLIPFPENSDARGSLSFAEGQLHVPFAIERVFWIYGVPPSQVRGSHSHNECAEVVVPVHGAFDMLVDDGHLQTVVRMDSPHTGILIPPGVWCRLQNFAPETVCVVLASHPYNAAGYINNYQEYRESLVQTVSYDASMANEWDAFVKSSKNGTFLLERAYMDYHANRFTDCSLLFYKKGVLLAVLPANWVEAEHTVYSHGGLTYGGLLLSQRMTAVEALEVFSCALEWMKRQRGAERWVYKPIPYIYNRLPAEEDLYALFRCGGILKARAISSVVERDCKLPMRTLRKRGVGKALANGVTYEESDEWGTYWKILSQVLQEKHNRCPVHSLEEIELLKYRFPQQIRLFVAKKGQEILAGTVVYEMERVAHAQYIAASNQGKEIGALDGLFNYLISERYADKAYFDFGISTEQGGSYLNEGLMFQKEGFGARAVVYDTYEIAIR